MSAGGVPKSPNANQKYSMAISDKAGEPGQISYVSVTTGMKQTINYFAGDSEKVFQVGDKVNIKFLSKPNR